MAKIVYYSSEISSETKEFDRVDVSIGDFLKEIGIEKDTINLSLTKDEPGEFGLDYILKEQDRLVIVRPVFGNDAGTKRTLAVIVQIAAIVGSILVGGMDGGSFYAAAIAITGGLVSGALNYRAAQLQAGANQAQEIEKMDIATNSYALSNVDNQVRAMEPVPLIIGSHRVIPDVMGPPNLDVKGASNNITELSPWQYKFYPGITSDNGPTATDNSWATIAQGSIVGGGLNARFPKYELKVAPYTFGVPKGGLTPSIQTNIFNKVRDHYLNDYVYLLGRTNYYYDFVGTKECAPLVVYHSDPSDPYYGRYNLFFLLARQNVFFGSAYYTGVLNDFDLRCFYEGSAAASSSDMTSNVYRNFFSNSVSGDARLYLTAYAYGTPYYYPARLLNPVTDNTQKDAALNHWKDFLLELNGGSYASSKAVSYLTENLFVNMGVNKVIQEGIDTCAQIVNYGLGDITISDRKIASLDAVNESPLNFNMLVYSPIEKSTWMVPGLSDEAYWYDSIKNFPNKKLSNVDSPTTQIPFDDQRLLNWNHYKTQLGASVFKFHLSGKIYGTSQSTGFVYNFSTIEIQVRRSDETNWRTYNQAEATPLFYYGNNNTKQMNHNINILFTLMPEYSDYVDNQDKFFEIRIRKLETDASNNGENLVCEMYITRAASINSMYGVLNENYLAPNNVEGIYWTALANQVGGNAKYSALCEAKCWVWDFDEEEWNWEHTRNPAWWFLYFAFGGFLRTAAPEISNFPYNNSMGFTNYVENPNATKILFGAGYKISEIDMDQLKAWALFCDDRDLKIDLCLRTDMSCAETLEKIANVGRGSVTMNTGKLSVVYEDPEQMPTCMFGMGNIKTGSFSVNYAVGDPTGKIIGNFINRDTWETESVEAEVPFKEADNLKELTINLDGITERQQAQREVNILAARQFFQRRTYSWSVDIEGLIAKRGDLVYLSHDSTQYGYSGRIKKFIWDSGLLLGIETSSIINSSIEHVTIRLPNGVMKSFACVCNGSLISFSDPYLMEDAPYYLNEKDINEDSDFFKSYAEDFIFIAGEKETPGKLVRISEITASGDFNFNITAVDEDPAMWAYEYDDVIPAESFDDSELALEVGNVEVQYLDDGLVKILWDGVDIINIINLANNLPVEANGSYTFTGGSVVIELTKGAKYNLEIRPFAIGTPFKSVSKKVFVWLV